MRIFALTATYELRVSGKNHLRDHPSRNSLLGKRKKIAKFLMRTFTYRSTFLYELKNRFQGTNSARTRICKPFKEPRNRFPAWRAGTTAGTTTLFLVSARHAT